MSGDKRFLDRWSARKRGALDEPSLPEAAEVQATDMQAAAPEDAKPDSEILAELDLPDPDTLGPGDDFKRFMTDAVPTHLRTRALRKLWISDPVLANLDELLDYGDDFTDAATVIENMQTAYKAGRGFLKDVVEDDGEPGDEEMEAGEPGDSEADDVLAVDGDGQGLVPIPPDGIDAASGLENQPVLVNGEESARQQGIAAAHQSPLEEPEEAFRPRRMRFKFRESG